MVYAWCSMPASERPVLSSSGEGMLVWVYEGGRDTKRMGKMKDRK